MSFDHRSLNELIFWKKIMTHVLFIYLKCVTNSKMKIQILNGYSAHNSSAGSNTELTNSTFQKPYNQADLLNCVGSHFQNQ